MLSSWDPSPSTQGHHHAGTSISSFVFVLDYKEHAVQNENKRTVSDQCIAPLPVLEQEIETKEIDVEYVETQLVNLKAEANMKYKQKSFD